ncbi:MAG: hypothetical protein HUJ76_06325 [Parasporobacterium sp.]|nr:hypothetical protein [Parasporobacterium sp.]
MYKCPNCGGEIEYLPSEGIIKCPYCDSEFSVNDIKLEEERKNAEEHVMEEGKVYTCSQCGAEIYTTDETGVTFCSFCGSQAFLESRINGSIAPDVIVPFRISRKQCAEIYRKKVRNAWFLPSDMKADKAEEKFRGIYMPCWIYSAEAQGRGSYTTSTTRREGAFDVINTYNVTVDFNAEWSGFIEDATSSFPDGIMKSIAPFEIKNAEPFNDRYISGFYADIGNVPSEAYNDEIGSFIRQDAVSMLSRDSEVKRNGVSAADAEAGTTVTHRFTEVKKGYIPVWFLSHKNKLTGRMSYAVINGVTGKIHADLPMDMKKYLLAALIIAVPAFILFQFFTLKPTILLVFVMALLAVLMAFSSKMITEAYIQENGLDDVGAEYLQHGSRSGGEIKIVRANKGTLKKILWGILCIVVFPTLINNIAHIYGIDITVMIYALGIIAFAVIAAVISSKSRKTLLRKVKLPFGVRVRSFIMPVAGLILGTAVLVAAPAHDMYYYGSVIICCILLILTVLDFVNKNNRLSLRKPAQLGKRGGDEDEA